MAKIAIIEDDAILRDILANKLSQEGYAVTGAADGEVAMEVIRKEVPDLVLLDMLLPKKSGIEILTEMRADEKLKNIAVIAISNTGEMGEINKAKELGIKDFLIKAVFDSGDVVKKVKATLGAGGAKPTSQPPPKADQPMAEKLATPAPQVTPTAPVAAPTSQPKTGEPRAENTGNHKVLIVEDDRFLRELAGQKLEKEGFTVMAAATGAEAFEFMAKQTPNIVILDLILPGMDGFEILAKIRENQAWNKIPVIILSNLGQEEDIDKAKKLGATDYLIKAHFSFGEIIKKIRETLANVR